jgi:pimeloyl-ACP methyl ester carboxylesterase
MSHSGWFSELATLLTALRLRVVGADRRGSGLNNQGRAEADAPNLLISDLDRIISQEDCGLPVYIVGWCWGAAPAIHVALRLRDRVGGLVLMAPGLFPSELLKQKLSRNLSTTYPDDFSPIIPSPLTDDMFTNVEKFRVWIANDDLALRAFSLEFFRITQNMMVTAAAGLTRLTQPTLILLAKRDVAVDNQKTLDMFARLCPAEVTVAHIPAHHGMQFEAPQQIATHISGWLRGHGVHVPSAQDIL